MISKPSQDQLSEIFERTWSELCDEYPDKREKLGFFSEADLQLHLAKKLVDKLPSGWVHIEVPLRLKRVAEFEFDLFLRGRPTKERAKGRRYEADIAIVDTDEMYPCLLAELKYNVIYSSLDFLGYLTVSKQLERDTVQAAKKWLRKLLRDLKDTEIRTQDLEFLMSNVDKLSSALRGFRGLGKRVQGYLCVIDELYPNAALEEELGEAV